MSRSYLKDAYHPEVGKLWWELTKEDGVGNYGAVPRMASWLRWNVEPGERFTTRQLREVTNSKQEHFQRRQRELRDLGWKYLTSKEEPSLGEECLLVEHGWWPGLGDRPKNSAISAKVRRQVLERDGARCVLCGRAAGEHYEDGTVVTLTAGHIRPNTLGGKAEIDNLRSECRVCNESARSDTGSVLDPESVLESIKELKKADRVKLLNWLQRGERTRSELDRVYDTVRLGGPKVRAMAMGYLEGMESRLL